jgi:hypothetical protein
MICHTAVLHREDRGALGQARRSRLTPPVRLIRLRSKPFGSKTPPIQRTMGIQVGRFHVSAHRRGDQFFKVTCDLKRRPRRFSIALAPRRDGKSRVTITPRKVATTAAINCYSNLTSVKDFGFNDASSRSRAGTRGSSADNSFDTESSTTSEMGNVARFC